MSTSRRHFLQAETAGISTALASAIGEAAPAGGKRPNIVFLLGEGQRADALSLAGPCLVQTPNHDRIGREGVYFRNSFCTNALCAPGRTAVTTGMYAHKSGGRDNHTENPLSASVPLITDLLHRAGYEVALCGKAHIGNGARERYWDYYFGFNAPVSNYYRPSVYEGHNGSITGPADFDGYADDVFTERALDWLKKDREKPFCLLLWFQAPHSPFWRARRHLDLFDGISIPKPSTFDDDLKGYPGKPRAFGEAWNKIGTTVGGACTRTLEETVKDYYAGLLAVDENIGKVLNWLTESRQLDDTVILHSSDHGYFLGEWRFFDKRFMHEPSIRVPTLLRYPRLFQGGRVVNEMVLDVDIAPTLLELAGVEIPWEMQGRSLVPLAKGQNPEWRKEWLYHYYEWPENRVRPHRGVRTERYKLIHYYESPEEFELYDLETDPGELHNLYSDSRQASLLRDMKESLNRVRMQMGDTA